MNPDTAEKYARHVNPAFVKLLGLLGYGRVFARALDVWLWDREGNPYLDFLAGFGSVNIGHNHPRLIRRLRDFLEEQALNLVHTAPSIHTADLAEALASVLPDPLKICLFSNSGAEAVEGGMKLARAATGRAGFIYCEGGFHGTNLGALSVMGAAHLRRPFEPLLNGCVRVPFGDLGALEKALSGRSAAAFVVEPIQCEGGIILPPAGYLKGAQDLCRRHGTVMVLDEVQTGLGRTGTLFAFEAEGFVPDILALAKSLSGSIAPIGATVTSREIHSKAYGSMSRFDLHSSTFGGNAFSCVAALETLRIIAEEKLVANSADMGKRLLEGLQDRLRGHPLVRSVRGRGLLVGVEFGPTDAGFLNKVAPFLVEEVARTMMGQWLALKLLERGVLCQTAAHRWNVLRLEPPLTVKPEHIDRAVKAVGEALDPYRSVAPLIRDVMVRLGSRFVKGETF